MVPVIIVTTWYDEKNPARRAEYEAALRENCSLGLRVIVLCEDDDAPPVQGPECIHLGRRPTFHDAISAVMPGEVVAIVNGDCYLPDDLEVTESVANGIEAWAISRHEPGQGVLEVEFAKWSQDAWVLRAPLSMPDCKFPFGYRGCDNYFAKRLQSAGFDVVNPCEDVIVTHLHAGGVKVHHDGPMVGPQGGGIVVYPSSLLDRGVTIPPLGKWSFNAGLLRVGDGWITADRYQTDGRLWAVMLRRFDANWREVERIVPKEWIGFEDVRLVMDEENGFILAFGSWVKISNRGHLWERQRVSVALSKITIGPMAVGPVVQLQADFPPQDVEKNWILFKRAGQWLASYLLRPHWVLSVDIETGKCCRAYISEASNWSWYWGEPRGGTPWLQMGEHMLTCWHSMLTADQMFDRFPALVKATGKGKFYFAAFAIAESKPPFRILATSARPLGCDDGIRFMDTDRYAYVTFPTSLHRDRDNILMSYGENDERTRIISIPWARIRESLIPMTTARSPLGVYRG
ncbi:hypothetical protein UFOVP141_9 [uncultured Caudovirales phage]|uniref:Uncharacterized protein n=1 Tax=uncultured Caudovirales phage TaxID=2100421 RepID=A0A6J7VNR9_9CAUD|nr:hypothetical protein UFOVP141_9 [uncultured Caudovirales phage]